MADVIAEIAAERRRQVEEEGWTPEHDDRHRDGSLAFAAACYGYVAATQGNRHLFQAGSPPPLWPPSWATKWWKPTNRRRDLVKAAALIVAEIERLDRAEARDDG